MSGIPVVASRMGGHEDLLGKGGGLLYDTDDPGDLAKALLRLYEERGLARKLAASAPPVKSMDYHVIELMNHYERLFERTTREDSS